VGWWEESGGGSQKKPGGGLEPPKKRGTGAGGRGGFSTGVVCFFFFLVRLHRSQFAMVKREKGVMPDRRAAGQGFFSKFTGFFFFLTSLRGNFFFSARRPACGRTAARGGGTPAPGEKRRLGAKKRGSPKGRHRVFGRPDGPHARIRAAEALRPAGPGGDPAVRAPAGKRRRAGPGGAPISSPSSLPPLHVRRVGHRGVFPRFFPGKKTKKTGVGGKTHTTNNKQKSFPGGGEKPPGGGGGGTGGGGGGTASGGGGKRRSELCKR